MVIDQFVKQEIYERVNTEIEAKYVALNEDGDLVVKSCDYKWLKLKSQIYVNGVAYKYSIVEGTDQIFILAVVPASDYVITLDNFYWYEGTPIDVTEVFSVKSNLTREKLPMVWLSFSPLPVITNERGTLNPYPYGIDFTIYLTGLTDYGTRHTEAHMREVVTYLSSYAEAVTEAIENNGLFSSIFTTKERQFPIFGRLNRDGFVENILDETELSGLELNLNLNTSIKCKC